MVKDATDTTARVELHAKSKTISVSISKLKPIGAGTKGLMGKSYPSGSFGGETPRYGGQTPAHGGATPHYSGAQTPMYGAQTPRHGGATPAYDGLSVLFVPGYLRTGFRFPYTELWWLHACQRLQWQRVGPECARPDSRRYTRWLRRSLCTRRECLDSMLLPLTSADPKTYTPSSIKPVTPSTPYDDYFTPGCECYNAIGYSLTVPRSCICTRHAT